MAYNVDHFHSQVVKTHQNNYKPNNKKVRLGYVCFYCNKKIEDGKATFIPFDRFSNVPICNECKSNPKHRG